MTPAALNFGGVSVKTKGLDRFHVIDGVESCLDNLSLGCDDILAT